MVSLLGHLPVDCPYCGEPFETRLDSPSDGERYIEDCPVCCRPVEFQVHVEPDGEWSVNAFRDDE